MQTLTIPQALRLAAQHQANGRARDAEAIYQQIIDADPRQADALYALGVRRFEAGDNVAAAELIARASAARPGHAPFACDLGTVLMAAARLTDAIAALRRAVSIDPRSPLAFYNLANALQANHETAAAIDAYRQSIALDPKSFEAHSNLGSALLDLKRHEEAVAAYTTATALRPDLPESHTNLALALQRTNKTDTAIAACERALSLAPEFPAALYGLGVAMQVKRQPEAAAEYFRRALAARPDYPEALNGLAVAQQRLERWDEASAPSRRALELQPDVPEAHCSLGAALRKQGSADEAIAHFRRAIELRPDFTEAHVNLGNALHDRLELDAAVASFRQALVTEPDLADAHACLAQTLLLNGDFPNGWAENEWRFRAESFKLTPWEHVAPRWRGEELAGRSIFLHVEQGYGDTFQFVRYVPLVAARGGRVALGCPPEIESLMRTVAAVEEVISGIEGRRFDVQCPLMSLPHVFGTTIDTIPATVPYLFAPRDRVDLWRERLAGDQRLKVGLVWAGRPAHANDKERSMTLQMLAPLAAVAGVRFFSLQKGPASEQLKSPPAGMELTDCDVALQDFTETAGLLSNLDLLIAVDTGVAHLAGALGRPVWVMLPFCPDFRWMTEREDTPWYPTMRLFRQERPREWEPVVARVVETLKTLS